MEEIFCRQAKEFTIDSLILGRSSREVVEKIVEKLGGLEEFILLVRLEFVPTIGGFVLKKSLFDYISEIVSGREVYVVSSEIKRGVVDAGFIRKDIFYAADSFNDTINVLYHMVVNYFKENDNLKNYCKEPLDVFLSAEKSFGEYLSNMTNEAYESYDEDKLMHVYKAFLKTSLTPMQLELVNYLLDYPGTILGKIELDLFSAAVKNIFNNMAIFCKVFNYRSPV